MSASSTTRFVVKDTAGRDRTLVIIQKINPRRGGFGGGRSAQPGFKTIATEDGGEVNRVKQGEYQIVATGEILRSDDPAAP